MLVKRDPELNVWVTAPEAFKMNESNDNSNKYLYFALEYTVLLFFLLHQEESYVMTRYAKSIVI